jgi:hypothetical protein
MIHVEQRPSAAAHAAKENAPHRRAKPMIHIDKLTVFVA